MSYFKIISKGEHPNRLFIGGIHGKEGRSTVQALEQLSEADVREGRLVIYNCDDTPYLSTLNRSTTRAGLVRKFCILLSITNPMFISNFTVTKENYKHLTSPHRRSVQEFHL